jgi:hypothetical protein
MGEAMRVLMRVALPAPPASDFELQWQLLLRRIGARGAEVREQGRLHFAMLDIEPGQITPTAEAVFRLSGVKPEFLPQITPEPYYGVRNY